MKKFFMVVLLMALFVVGEVRVDAANFTDMSEANYQFVTDDKDLINPVYFDLAITGASFQEGSTYSVHFSHDKNETVTVDSTFVKAKYVSRTALKVDGMLSDEIIEAVEKAGDIYIWVREENAGEKKVIASKVKVERPTLSLGVRLIGEFRFEQTRVIARYPSVDNYKDRSVTYKIGRVLDIDLVRNLNSSDVNVRDKAYQTLYAFAKKDTSPYRRGTVKIGESESITKNMGDMVDGAYYYIYMEYQDARGTYYSFDDVNIYQAANCDLEPTLNHPSVPEFVWPEEDKHYCEIVDGKYYGKNGNEVDEATYLKECTNPEPEKKICKIEGDKYYGKDGNEVDKDTYLKECTTEEDLKCEIVDGKYYDKDGNLVDKETYEVSCGTTDNPNTGVNFGLGIAFITIVFGTGLYTVMKKKNKFPQA